MKASKLIFAAICAGAIFASCAPQDVEEVIVPAPSREEVLPAQLCTISIDATKGIDSKALALDGSKLTATWESGETVAVYKKGSNTKLGTLSPKTTGVATTSLEGDVDISGLAVDDELFLLYPDRGWTYDGQDGTLETVSSDYDFATATVKVTSVSSTHMSAESAAFKNQQAIVKFNLKDKANGNALPTPDFTILSKNKKLVRYHDMNFDPEPSDNFCFKVGLDDAKSELTLAIASADDSSDDYYFIANTNPGDPSYYELLKEGIHFDQGKYYEGNLSLAKVSYTVAGSSDAVFGTIWDPSNTDNDMEFNGSYFFKSFDDVPAGSIIELKVVKNHAWSGDGGAEYPSKNVIVTAWADGSLGVTYYPFGNVVEAEMFYPGGEPAIPDVYTISFRSGDEFYINTPTDDLTDNGDGTYSYSTLLEAGKYYFKIFKNRAYDIAYWPYDSPYYVDVTSKSTLNVLFTPATNDIQTSFVAYVEPDVYRVAGTSYPTQLFGSEWEPALNANLMGLQADGKTYIKTFTAVPALTCFEFKIVKNGTVWIPDPGDNYTYVAPDAGDVTISYNSESGEISVSGPSGDIYRVAGDSEGDNSGSDAIFNTAWAPANNANLMNKVNDDKYSIKYTDVPAGTTLTFKVVKNGTDWSPDPNQSFTTSAISDVTISYQPSTGAIDVFAESLSAKVFVYHGTEYPIVNMKDGKWWMAKNLAYVPEGFTVSTSLSEVTAGVFAPIVVNSAQTAAEFSTDPSVIAAKGYLYQSEVALGLQVGDLTTVEEAQNLEGAQGLCPYGWHVPTIDDITGLVGKAVSPIATNASAPYYDGSNGSISLLNEDGFNMDAFGAISIQDNTKIVGTFMGWASGYPDKISSGMICGSTYSGVTYNTTNDPSSGVKNLQFYGLMPMTNKTSEAQYTCNGTKMSYRIAGPVRCVRN